MKTYIHAWALSLLMMLGLGLGMVQDASARSLVDQLPVTKEPTSAKFDIKGNITSKGVGDPISILINGGGQMAKDKLQLDMTLSVPGLPATPGSPNSFTISTITLDQKVYFKISGLSTEGEDKWYVSDLSETTGGTGLMPGMGAGMTGLDPALAGALKSTPMGKEAIYGASTTKYRIDVDLKKLNDLSGGTTNPSTAAALNDATMMLYMWVGDDDTYLHQAQLLMNVIIAEPNSGPSSELSIDLTMTFKEFDQPVNIVAPANAEPLGTGSANGLGGILAGVPGGTIVGMPIAAGMGMGVGMPSSGAPDRNSLLPLLVLLGLVMVGSGAGMRGRSAYARARI